MAKQLFIPSFRAPQGPVHLSFHLPDPFILFTYDLFGSKYDGLLMCTAFLLIDMIQFIKDPVVLFHKRPSFFMYGLIHIIQYKFEFIHFFTICPDTVDSMLDDGDVFFL